MGTKERQRAARRRRAAKEARFRCPADRAARARPFRLVAERINELRGDVAAAANREEAAAAAREKVASGATRLAALGPTYDAFDVREDVRLSQTTSNPEPYRQAEDEGTASTVEIVAAPLAGREACGSRTTSWPPPTRPRRR